MWIDPQTGEVARLHSDIRSLRPNWGGGAILRDEDIAEQGFEPVMLAEPQYDPINQSVTELAPALIDGSWMQQWSITPLPETESMENLEAARRAKELEINDMREQANMSTFPFTGKLVACDRLSRSDIDGVANHINLLGTFPPNFPGGWLATDNTYIPLPTIDDFKAMYSAMARQGTANFTRSQALKAKVRVATTQAQLDAVTWTMTL